MISTFRIRNFRSILDMTVDFRFAEGKAPNGYKSSDMLPFVEVPKGDRIVPCLALFGANASGKTNVIRALSTFRNAVLNNVINYCELNKLHDDSETTIFDIEFFIYKDQFTYSIDYRKDGIRKEKLLKNGKPLFEVENLKGEFSKQVKTENYSKDRLQSILDVECSDGQNRQAFTFLSRVGKNYKGLNRDLLNVYSYMDLKFMILLDNDISLPSSVDNLKHYFDGDQEKALAEIVDLVRKLDIDIKNIEIKREEVEQYKEPPANMRFSGKLLDRNSYEAINIVSHHTNLNGNDVPFDFMDEESEGTIRIAGLIGTMLFALKGGHVLFADELDCSLHPLLLRELIRLFKDKRYNTKGAQLVFTTHNTDILDDSILRVSEVAIIRKTLKTGSMIKRIVDFKEDGMDVRNVTNFRKQYLDGFYSGVPHPSI
ncbi:MAG: ATP-binding protein [Kiritimatiellae bacterium]|jgi:AAA15 family ATPase/GTPase|nr:ATP-binding protein [Kiritimatiellia bacterium]